MQLYLTPEEERIYNGEHGETLAKCMELLVALGDIYGAEGLIPVKSVQIAGVSYKTIGDAGLEWISDLQGRVVVPAVLNPAGMDLERWQEMGVGEDFAGKQLEIISAYMRLGVRCECTCTPYHVFEELAGFGEHLAWSESSAVVYANSVIGARTNREGAPAALAAALLGKTANYGLHLEENRAPTVRVKVEERISDADFGALGFVAGKLLKNEVPFFEFSRKPELYELKQLGAAMAASGSVALYHVRNCTPEAGFYTAPSESIALDRREIMQVYDAQCEPDLIALGCPHLSGEELRRIAELLEGRRVVRPLWVFTSRELGRRYSKQIDAIIRSGAEVFYDTCMVVSPASERFGCVMVNSGKALNYVPGLCGVSAVLATTQECIRRAVEE
jgi:hypothetical protein